MRLLKKYIFFAALLISGMMLSCENDSSGPSTHLDRPFLMGFTPWPYDGTLEAVDWTYGMIRDQGDIISHHIEEGIPWQESLSGVDFPTSFLSEINFRTSKSTDLNFVLSLNPLNIERNGLALYRSNTLNSKLPAPWDTMSLNNQSIKTAFVNYAERMISYFNPRYLLIGIEVNLLLRNNPTAWDDYLELHQYVYRQLKTSLPSIPIGVSLFSVPFFPEWSAIDSRDLQVGGLRDLEPFTDFIAFSVHPFMSSLLADEFPDEYMKRLFELTDKPVAISESSYPAQKWQTQNEPYFIFDGTQQKQNNFLSNMLREASASNAIFVIWWCIRDFDALWENFLGKDNVSLIWRDTGLFDEEGTPREANISWQEWFNKAYKPAP